MSAPSLGMFPLGDDVRELCAVLAVVITLAGQVPYLRQMLTGTCTPHAFSWTIWTLVTGLGAAVQYSSGAGWAGTANLAATAAICGVISCYALVRGDRSYSRLDWTCLLAGVAGALAWPLLGPVAALTILIVVDLVGYLPTVVKSWRNPHSEVAVMWAAASLKHVLGIAALAQLNGLTVAYPAALLIANGALTVLLLGRRRVLARPATPALPDVSAADLARSTAELIEAKLRAVDPTLTTPDASTSTAVTAAGTTAGPAAEVVAADTARPTCES